MGPNLDFLDTAGGRVRVGGTYHTRAYLASNSCQKFTEATIDPEFTSRSCPIAESTSVQTVGTGLLPVVAFDQALSACFLSGWIR